MITLRSILSARGVPRLLRGGARLFLVATLLVATGCASVAPLETATREPVSAPVFRFGEDTFAFPNEVRSLNPGREDLYANYCFVMTRGVVQFLKFARFDPSGAKLQGGSGPSRLTREERWGSASRRGSHTV